MKRFVSHLSIQWARRAGFKRTHQAKLEQGRALRLQLMRARLRKGVACRVENHRLLGLGIRYPDSSVLLLPTPQELGLQRPARGKKRGKPLFPNLVLWQGKRLALVGSRRATRRE